MTDASRMDEILDLLTDDEVGYALHGVDVYERTQFMDADEATEWWRWILARQRFLGLGRDSQPAC